MSSMISNMFYHRLTLNRFLEPKKFSFVKQQIRKTSNAALGHDHRDLGSLNAFWREAKDATHWLGKLVDDEANKINEGPHVDDS